MVLKTEDVNFAPWISKGITYDQAAFHNILGINSKPGLCE